jgi:hypothetical protein
MNTTAAIIAYTTSKICVDLDTVTAAEESGQPARDVTGLFLELDLGGNDEMDDFVTLHLTTWDGPVDARRTRVEVQLRRADLPRLHAMLGAAIGQVGSAPAARRTA